MTASAKAEAVVARPVPVATPPSRRWWAPGILVLTHRVAHIAMGSVAAHRNVNQASKAPGFTLIELVVVMMLVAAITIIVLMRVQPAESSTPVQVDRLVRDIRHVQMLAMQWGVPLRLTSTAVGYSVVCVSGSATPPCNGASPIVDPADPARPGGYVVALANSVTLNLASINFDGLGRPCAAPCTALADVQTTATTFSLTGGSRPPSSVTVRPLTGSTAVAY